MPMRHVVGRRTPTMLVVSRRPACSGSSTMATTYGGSRPGYHGWWFTVKVWTVASPDAASGARFRPRHAGQIGPGGWIQYPQSPQRRKRSSPSAPPIQKCSVSGVTAEEGGTAGRSPRHHRAVDRRLREPALLRACEAPRSTTEREVNGLRSVLMADMGDDTANSSDLATSREADTVIELVEVEKRFGGAVAVERIDIAIERGEFFSMLGPSGLRQDHHPAHDRRLRAAHRRARSASRARTSRRSRRTGATSTPSSSTTRCSRTCRSSTTSPSAPAAPKIDKDEVERSGSTRCSRSCASPTSPTAGPASSPAASSSASRWPGRWSTTRAPSCSTSRSAPST